MITLMPGIAPGGEITEASPVVDDLHPTVVVIDAGPRNERLKDEGQRANTSPAERNLAEYFEVNEASAGAPMIMVAANTLTPSERSANSARGDTAGGELKVARPEEQVSEGQRLVVKPTFSVAAGGKRVAA